MKPDAPLPRDASWADRGVDRAPWGATHLLRCSIRGIFRAERCHHAGCRRSCSKGASHLALPLALRSVGILKGMCIQSSMYNTYIHVQYTIHTVSYCIHTYFMIEFGCPCHPVPSTYVVQSSPVQSSPVQYGPYCTVAALSRALSLLSPHTTHNGTEQNRTERNGTERPRSSPL